MHLTAYANLTSNGYEISYHSHPRPSHEDMGGKTYAKGKARTVNGVHYPSFEAEAKSLLEEYGCLHFKFSVLLGVSTPTHTKEQLAQLKADDKKTFEFEGKEYTKYEASQTMNKIESRVKKLKDRANIAAAAGDDDLRREEQYKINLLTNKYAQLSKASGLPTKMERMSSGKSNKTVDKYSRSGIMEMKRRKDVAHRRIGSKGQQIIDKPTYNKLTKEFLKNDGLIIRGKEAENHLKYDFASFLPSLNTAFIRDDATVSDVLEEMYHARQYRINKFGKVLTEEVRLKREIDAQKYLLSMTDKYKIPKEEVEVTRKNLLYYENKLKKYYAERRE